MIIDFGINKNSNIKTYKKIGLNTRVFKTILNNKQKKLIQKNFNIKLFGKLLKQKIKNRIDFLIKNKTFKGVRHKKKLPARGQRTHTNAKTKKKIKLY
jgi:small subunit ribosomal protein S13